MRRFSIALLFAILLASPGCMNCENGLTTPGEKEATFDPALLGEWEFFDPKPEKGMEGYFKVERDDRASKAYRVTAITLPVEGKEVAKPAVVKVYLARLGEFTFLDAFEPPDSGGRDRNPNHFIFIIDIKKDELSLRALDEDFIKVHPELPRLLETNKLLGIKLVKVTATTPEMLDFIGKHASDNKAWKGPASRLKRR
jgi:hypothetical protein